LSFLFYIFSSIKLEKRAEQFLPGSKGVRGGWVGEGGRNDPNNVSTYEYMNKGKKIAFPTDTASAQAIICGLTQ
jgi:hypothetical protein